MASSTLPSILCLHGSGTSAEIFEIQTIRLRRELRNRVNFTFIDAPFETDPGPGVVPVFQDSGPFYTWMQNEPEVTRDSTADFAKMSDATVALLERTMREEKARSGGNGFVGVLGFSMGARLAAGLLLDQQQRPEKSSDNYDCDGGNPSKESDSSGNSISDSNGAKLRSLASSLKFGIFICGTSPPITTLPLSRSADTAGPKVMTPSLHVFGLDDPYFDEGELLLDKNFQKERAVARRLDMGHHLPVQKEDNSVVAKEILKLVEMCVI